MNDYSDLVATMEMLADSFPVDETAERLTKLEWVFQSPSLYGTTAMPSGKLVEAIEFLKEKLEEIPEEHRSEAVLEIEGEDDGYGASWAEARIYYPRPETDEEMDFRLKKARRQAEQRDAAERAEYERLRARYAT